MIKKPLSKKHKSIIIGVITPICAVLLIFIILCIVTACKFSPAYLNRVLSHWDSKITDYKIFPERIIQKSDRPFVYDRNYDDDLSKIIVKYSDGRKIREKSLDNFVDESDTTAFIAVKNDAIVYERYSNGYGENSVNTSFSMAKSVVSLLVGKAIEEGYIESVKQPIKDYIPEFAEKEIGETTIEELLLMRSDIAYDEDKLLWFGDDSLTYFYDDLRSLAINHTDLKDYGGRFHYNNYHPLLLGIILERSTGISVSEYFGKSIWEKIGAEYDASWSLDGDKSGFEKMESGINFQPVDFLKIGSAVLHDGFWNGSQIINSEWLKASVITNTVDYSEYDGTFLSGRNIAYGYMWYSMPSGKGGYDIFAWGKSDQILYISPDNGTIILRLGKTDGGIADWAETLNKLCGAFNK